MGWLGILSLLRFPSSNKAGRLTGVESFSYSSGTE